MEPKAVILFDGVCNLCNASVQFIISNEREVYFTFASLQSEFGQELLVKNGLNNQNFDSFVLLENKVVYQESSAAVRVAKHLKFPYSLLAIFYFVPKFIRNWGYRFIAKNRYRWFGKKDACMIPSPALKDRFIV